MPPKIKPHRASIPSSCQCYLIRPQIFFQEHQVNALQTRSIHPPGYINAKATRLRRDMLEWLQSSGKAFRDPLPNSTNYLSAYDRQGNLIRTKRARQGYQDKNDAATEQAIPEEQEADIQAKEIAEGLDEDERSARLQARQAARSRQAEQSAEGSIPKEGLNDMRPFPLNTNFRSQPVLSEELREAIYNQVVGRGLDIGTVAMTYGVDTRRVAAVVRLKTIEKQWIDEGKPLAKPYNDAVMAMLPQTPFRSDMLTEKIIPHESINDLTVHSRTRQQIFWPASESRYFTRDDAAKVFDDHLLPPDKRIAHPELVTVEKENLENIDRTTRITRQRERDLKAREDKEMAEQRRKDWETRTQRIVAGRRWDFKFQDFNAEKTGKNGRARGAVGARYGMPHEDRKRGIVKIPTSVE